MLRKLVLGLAVVVATSSVVTTGSAEAGPLTRVRGAIRANLEGDKRALHDLACGLGARQAARDVIGGAKLGVTILRGAAAAVSDPRSLADIPQCDREEKEEQKTPRRRRLGTVPHISGPDRG